MGTRLKGKTPEVQTGENKKGQPLFKKELPMKRIFK